MLRHLRSPIIAALTLGFCLNAELFVAHAGDCRCYLYRHNRLYRLTADHTLAEEMVRQGAMTAEEAATSRWNHVVTNAVGANSADVTVELHKVGLLPDDVLLLCSDGLTGMVGGKLRADGAIANQEQRLQLATGHTEPRKQARHKTAVGIRYNCPQEDTP